MCFETPYKDKGMEKKLTTERIKALDRYYKSPNICNNCGKIIEVKSHQKIHDAKVKKFCNSGCASTFNNKRRPERAGKKPRFDKNNSLYQKKWYSKNKKLQQERNEKIEIRKKEFVLNLKKNSKCSMCSEGHFAVLDFHHLNPSQKDRTISEMIKDSVSLEKIKLEIKKCIIVCANCHRKLHYEERLKKDLQII